jgi:maleylpyruvate isomerase
VIRLYSYFRSSSAWRVRIALAYKQIPYELAPIHLLRDGGHQHGADLMSLNPMAQVPVIEVSDASRKGVEPPAESVGGHRVDPSQPSGTFVLTQSIAILEYIEETHPDPPLWPSAPESRARARQLAEIVNSGIQPLQNLSIQQTLRASGVDPLPWIRQVVENGLRALEAGAKSSAGTFLVGDAFTVADVCLVPQLFSARRFGVDVDSFALLRRVERACETLSCFVVAHPQAQPDYEPER